MIRSFRRRASVPSLLGAFLVVSSFQGARAVEPPAGFPRAVVLASEETLEALEEDRERLELFLRAVQWPARSWRDPAPASGEAIRRELVRARAELGEADPSILFSGVWPASIRGECLVVELESPRLPGGEVPVRAWRLDPAGKSARLILDEALLRGERQPLLVGLSLAGHRLGLASRLAGTTPPPLGLEVPRFATLESLRLSGQTRRLASALRARRARRAPEVWVEVYLARMAGEEGRLEEALQSWELALQAGGLGPFEQGLRSEVLARRGSIFEARLALRQGLEHLRRTPDLELRESLHRSLSSLEPAVVAARERAEAWRRAGARVFRFRNEREAHREAGAETTREDADDPESGEGGAGVLERVRRLERSRLFRRALALLTPEVIEADTSGRLARARARVLLLAGRAEEVPDLLSGREPLDLDDLILLGDAHQALSQFLWQPGRWLDYSDEALPRLSDYRDLEKPSEPGALEHWRIAGELYARADLLEMAPDRAWSRHAEWRALDRPGDDPLLEAGRSRPASSETRRVVATILDRRGEQREARSLFLDFAIEHLESSSRVHEFAEAWLDSDPSPDLEDVKRVLELLREVADDPPWDVAGWRLRARCLLLVGEARPAATLLRRTISESRAVHEYFRATWAEERLGPRSGRPPVMAPRNIETSLLPGAVSTFHDLLRVRLWLARAHLELGEPRRAWLELVEIRDRFLAREQARLRGTRRLRPVDASEWTRLPAPRDEPVDPGNDRERRLWSRLDLVLGRALAGFGNTEEARFHLARAARRLALERGRVRPEAEWSSHLEGASRDLVIESLESLGRLLPVDTDAAALEAWIAELRKGSSGTESVR